MAAPPYVKDTTATLDESGMSAITNIGDEGHGVHVNLEI